MKQYASAILRIGVASVFIWFGFQQLSNTYEWIGWLPEYASALPFSATTLVYINGVFEVVFGFLLLLGLFTRVSASLLALHMTHIISVVGYGEIGVRDFGIFMATLSLAFSGVPNFSLDLFFKNRQQL
ncbi:MAG: hypothetical protein COV96_00560 [Candidatus Zambryskibacteria bacterium CG11_big_fil_rev_8_21_14_0_20_42_18]|nr:MAG: hypothetical protein COV96_00560 [Candidatus Zambryskibacteria bacterium CG11_big_fil_rev_8_21_14_0_20_42_18]